MKRILLVLAGALAVLAGVLVFRATRLAVVQPPLEALDLVPIEAGALERLAGAIRIPTVTRSEEPCFDPATFAALDAHLRASFPSVFSTLELEVVGGHALLFTWKGRDPARRPILLMAHQDVVPAPIEATPWTHPPFAGVVEGGYLWGRGAIDVKSGLVGILEAVEMHLGRGFQPERTIYLAFGHDEEIGGAAGAKAIAALLGERGVRLELVLDEGAGIVEGVIPDVSVPVALIGVAEKGYVSLELVATVEGGHSSMPPSSTAIGVLGAAIAMLEAEQFPARTGHSLRTLELLAPKMPFAKRIVFANLWLTGPIVSSILLGRHTTAATIRTTTAPTIFRAGVKDNVLPNEATAVVNFRIIPGETPETVQARVEDLLAGRNIEVRPYHGSGFASPPSPVSSVDSEAYRVIASTIRSVARDPELIVVPSLVVGATDSRHFQPIADGVYRFFFNRIGPADIARIHGIDERISVENYTQTIQFYYHLIARAAGPAGSSR